MPIVDKFKFMIQTSRYKIFFTCLIYVSSFFGRLSAETLINDEISFTSGFSHLYDMPIVHSELDLKFLIQDIFVHTQIQMLEFTSLDQRIGYAQQSLWYNAYDLIFFGATTLMEKTDWSFKTRYAFDLYLKGSRFELNLSVDLMGTQNLKLIATSLLFQNIYAEIENSNQAGTNWLLKSEFQFWNNFGPRVGYQSNGNVISIGAWFKKGKFTGTIEHSFESNIETLTKIKLTYQWGLGHKNEVKPNMEILLPEKVEENIEVSQKHVQNKKKSSTKMNHNRSSYMPSLAKLLEWKLSAYEALLFTKNKNYCGLSDVSISILKEKRVGGPCEK